MDEHASNPLPPAPETSKHQSIWIVATVVLAIVLLLFVGWIYFNSVGALSSLFSGSHPLTEEQVATTSPNPTAAMNVITWDPNGLDTPIRSLSVSSESKWFNHVDIYKVGTVASGSYAGDDLAIAFYTDQWNPKQYDTQTYAYFISDASGRPIAWDRRFIQEFSGSRYPLSNEIGLVDSGATTLSFLPIELNFPERSSGTYLISTGARFSVPYGHLLGSEWIAQHGVPSDVGRTDSGFTIVRIPNPQGPSILNTESYYIALPFGAYQEIDPEPDFMSSAGYPTVAWDNSTTTTQVYNYGQYAYGVEDCYADISQEDFDRMLVKTGITPQGSPVYEINQSYNSIYQCWYEKTRRYTYNVDTGESMAEYPMTYTTFLQTHPVFFWRNLFGDLLIFVRQDVVPPAEKAKPVIYLYPQQTEQVSVWVEPVGGFTKTEPVYRDGWNVTATPRGVLTTRDGTTYPYLFWEGGAEGTLTTPKEGFVVERTNIQIVLEEKLTLLGLSEQERDDFITFWTPRLQRTPYYFITFIPQKEIDRVAPLTVLPKPDSVIRILMDYKPLQSPIAVQPLSIVTPERNGFTVVEWGGIIRD